MKHLNLALAVSLLGCGSLRDYPLDVPADRPVDATDGAVSDTPTDQPTPTDLPTDNGPADVPTVDVPAADVPRADVLADVPLTDVPLIDVPSVDVPPMDVAVDAGSADVPLDVSAADVPMDVQVADLPLDVPVDAGAADVPLDVPADVPRVDAGVDAATDVVVPCAMGQTRCGGACVNLLADVMHCGACGNACASGTSCIAQGASAQCRRTHWNVNTDTDWLTNPNTDGAWSFGRDRSELFALATMRAPVMGSAGICAGWGDDQHRSDVYQHLWHYRLRPPSRHGVAASGFPWCERDDGGDNPLDCAHRRSLPHPSDLPSGRFRTGDLRRPPKHAGRRWVGDGGARGAVEHQLQRR